MKESTVTPVNTAETHWNNIRDFFQQHGVVKVVFTKANGDERTMVCTRDTQRIPEVKRPKTTPQPNFEVMPVFEFTDEGKTDGQWRSFRIDSLISITKA